MRYFGTFGDEAPEPFVQVIFKHVQSARNVAHTQLLLFQG